jgi:hypothetical protein
VSASARTASAAHRTIAGPHPDLSTREFAEPIELGRSHVEGLRGYVLKNEEVAAGELADLCRAVKLYCGV